MVEYRKSSHAIWDVKYHLVWITKYRYKVLRGEVAVRTRDLLRQICEGREVVIVQGAVSPDHIHMLVSVPPQLAPAKLVQYLKGRSSRILQDEFPQLKKRYWGQHLWARGYFCASVGARWTRRRSASTSKVSNGKTPERTSRSPRPASLEAGSQPGALQAASAANGRLSVAIKPTGFKPVVV
jgi:REP-associated tyrosine transposase